MGDWLVAADKVVKAERCMVEAKGAGGQAWVKEQGQGSWGST